MTNRYFEISIGDLIDGVNDINYSCGISNCLIYERHIGPDLIRGYALCKTIIDVVSSNFTNEN